MLVSTELKTKIIEIIGSEEFLNNKYIDISNEDRLVLGMVYTPAEVCIQLIEKINCSNLADIDILDPTCGSGNLLIACLIAGANSERLFGNEYNAETVLLCRKRINRACDILGKPHIKDWQIHHGSALQKKCLIEFGDDYYNNYNPSYIDDLEYAQGKLSWDQDNLLAAVRLENKLNINKISEDLL